VNPRLGRSPVPLSRIRGVIRHDINQDLGRQSTALGDRSDVSVAWIVFGVFGSWGGGLRE
jgi:hypothetical protein